MRSIGMGVRRTFALIAVVDNGLCSAQSMASVLSYNQKLWMHHLIEGAAYLPLEPGGSEHPPELGRFSHAALRGLHPQVP